MMTFKPGDKVKFLNDVGGGVITKIVKDQAYVMIDDGFDIPMPISQLVKINSELPVERDDKPVITKSEQKKAKQEEKKIVMPEAEDDIEDDSEEEVTSATMPDFGTLTMLLGFIVENSRKEGRLYHAYLINDCLYRSLYTFSVVQEGHYKTLKAGLLENETKVFLYTFKAKELSEIQSIQVDAVFYRKTSYIPHEPLVYKLTVDTFKFSDNDNYTVNDFFDENAFIINITEMDLLAEIEKVSQQQQPAFIHDKNLKTSPKVKQIKVAADNEEVDLHIEQLTDKHRELEASEILDIQMSKFQISLEGAIRNNTKRIIFIHGIGNGKLKFEIRKALDTKYPKYRYQDASFKEYGYGATLVILK